MTRCMTRRVQWLQFNAANLDRNAVFDADIGTGQTVEGGYSNLAAYLVFELERRGNVIGMDVRINALGQR